MTKRDERIARIKEAVLNAEFERLWTSDTGFLIDELEKEIERSGKLRKALNLALYYVEGDSTWEGVVEKVEGILGYKLKDLEEKS